MSITTLRSFPFVLLVSPDFAVHEMNRPTLLVFWLIVISVSVESYETGPRHAYGQVSEEEGSSTGADIPLVPERKFWAAQSKSAEAGNFGPGAQNLIPESRNSLQRYDNVGNKNSKFGYNNSPDHQAGNNYFMPGYNSAGYRMPGQRSINSAIPSTYPFNSFLAPRYRAMNPRHKISSPSNDFMSKNYDIKPTYDILDPKFGYSQPFSRPLISGRPSEVSHDEIEKGFMSTDPLITSNDKGRGRFSPTNQGINSMNAGQYALMLALIEMAAKSASASPLETGALYRMDKEHSDLAPEIRKAQLEKSGSVQGYPYGAGGIKISNPQNTNSAHGEIRSGYDSEPPKIQLSQNGKYDFLALK